nr:hypothetical protein [Enhygromyxa salina]
MGLSGRNEQDITCSKSESLSLFDDRVAARHEPEHGEVVNGER